jgi:basic membrane protein A
MAAKERGDIDYVFTENTSNTDYERVMREYCEAGNKLIVGEVFGVEDAARAVAKDYPDVAFLMGSSFKPMRRCRTSPSSTTTSRTPPTSRASSPAP